MTLKETILKAFDEQFGTDGPDRNCDSVGRKAGCDDCSSCIELRKEHRDFVSSQFYEFISKILY